MKTHPCATCAVAIAVAGTTLSAISAGISPNPHQVTRIVETDADDTISDFANLGVLRKRGEGSLTLSAPGLASSGEVVAEEGTVVIDLDASPAVPALPSTLTGSIALWLDASQNVLTDGDGAVTYWFDRRETNPTAGGTQSRPYATSQIQRVSGLGAGAGAPALVTDGDIAPYVDFGPHASSFASGKWLSLANTEGSGVGLQKMVEAFVVVAKHPDDAANTGLGTIFSGYYNGTRCNPIWYGTTAALYGTTDNTRADRGATRLDRSPVWSGHVTIPDTDFHIVSTRLPIDQSTAHGDKWNLLGADRDLTSGGMRIAEVIAFPVRISEFDRMRVEDYLWRKWMGSRQTTVGTVGVNGGACVLIDTDSDVAGDLTGGGAVVKTGTGTLRAPALEFSGTVELREGGVRTAGAAFALPSAGQVFTATAASVVSVAATNAGLVVKNGYGPMTISSLPAEAETLSVERGTLTLAPAGASGAAATPCAAATDNADFEDFSVSDFSNVGGASGSAAQTDGGWTFDRSYRTAAGNAVTLVKNSYNTGTFKLQALDYVGIGYDGAVSLLLCQGRASTTFTVPASGIYKASFRVAGYGTAPFHAQVLVNGNAVREFTALDTTSFMRYEVELPFLASGDHTFTISDVDDETNRILFDDLKVLPVEIRGSAPVAVAIANPSFEEPWSNLAGQYADTAYAPDKDNCSGWTMPNNSSVPWVAGSLRRRWFNGMGTDTFLANGLASNPDEMPDGFLCAQLYSTLPLSQSVTFPSEGRYRLRFHLARRQGSSPQQVVVTVGGTVVRKVVVRHDEFRPYEAVFDLADGGARTLQFAGTVASSVNAHLSGCALLDAVSCERVSDIPANLVANGGFEDGTAQWTREGFLNVVSTFVAANWADGIARSPLQGADSLAFAIDSPTATVRQDVAFPAAGRYVLAFRFQAFDAYPDLLTSVHRFWVKVGDDRILLQTMFADDREHFVAQPFTVPEAGTKTLEFGFERWINGSGCKANVMIDDVSIVAAAASDRTDLARHIPTSLEVDVSDTDEFGTVLNLDFDGDAKVRKIVHNGRKIIGEISHALYPEWVMGRGRIHADPNPFVLVVR